jgi:PBP1b-binding outer membrane lipoprotein LpoB
MKSVVSFGTLAFAVLLSACQPTNKASDAEKNANNDQATAAAVIDGHAASQTFSQAELAAAQAAHAQLGTPASAATTTATTPVWDGKPRAVDWAKVDSGVKPVDADTFKYPFTLDSAPVKAYMDAYQVDAKTARYNLTVGMAVNEVLNKVLDQIDTSYVSHELTAGKNSKFIIHTTKQIAPSEHTYVFAEPFAHGLSIPVQIINDGKK